MILRSDEKMQVVTPGGGLMQMHLFRPATEGRFPGVLLFSEIYQVTGPIGRLAAMLAGNGYVVAVPEVFHEFEPVGAVLNYDSDGTERGNCLKYAKPLASYDADAEAAIGALLQHPACDGRIVTFGVCLGGHLAYRAALDPRVSAAACFYATDIHSGSLGHGSCDDSLARMQDLKAETMFVWGRQDPHIPYSGRIVIQERLEAVGASYEWHEFNAQHAFLRDEGHRYDPELLSVALNLTLGLYRRAFRGEQRGQNGDLSSQWTP
ncbi:dienelactone hydrolase family protein [Sphingobium sp. YR768]|uniref:dienelactone hydrolase family protein n=1 Tax=Sphingobium sp. YR768 TaxID=1884365 RepID=UPI0008C3B02E|nr:dienelactone hydrolase family protein [Sphingobium sp. YR768]SES19120.1 carboxymethylenebutenolidase [Sphingobium sp. YR768]